MNVIAARWKAMILYHLMQHPELRYGQIRERLDGIADRVLTTQLKELVADRAIEAVRRGRHVAYALSVEGQELAPVFEALMRWGQARQAEQAHVKQRATPFG
jgi:DNA-binding HxlR family transcriptional regulator